MAFAVFFQSFSPGRRQKPKYFIIKKRQLKQQKNSDLMPSIQKILLFAVLAMLPFMAMAHETGYPHEEPFQASYLPVNPLELAVYVFLLVLVIALVSLYLGEKLSDKTKKAFFIVIVMAVVATTIYAAGTTVLLNVISESQGPVHWHADFEIWVCGQQVKNLVSPVFPSNKVGTETFHHHDDYRIHVEGVVVKKQDVSLARFFEAIGGQLTKDTLTIPLNNSNRVTYTNGMLCPNGKPGKLKLLAMNNTTAGQLVEKPELDEYVLSPYVGTIVEGKEGDFLMIVFGTEGEENGS